MRLKPSPPGSSSLLATGFVALQPAPRSKTAQAERAHQVRSQEESDVAQEGVGTSQEPLRNARSRQRTIREECASRKPDGRAFREERVVRNTCTHAPSRRSSGNGGAGERVEQKDVSRRHGRELLGRRVRTCVRRRRRKQWSGELFRSGGEKRVPRTEKESHRREEVLFMGCRTDRIFGPANFDTSCTDAWPWTST